MQDIVTAMPEGPFQPDPSEILSDAELGRFAVGDEDGPFGILAEVQDFAGAFRRFADAELQGAERAALRTELAKLISDYMVGDFRLADDVLGVIRGEAARLPVIALAAGVSMPLAASDDFAWLYAEFPPIVVALLRLVAARQEQRDEIWLDALEREQQELAAEDAEAELDEDLDDLEDEEEDTDDKSEEAE